MCDGINNKKLSITEKIKDKQYLINSEAKSCFKVTLLLIIKYTYSFNIHRLRDRIINKEKLNIYYPWYNQEESQSYIIQ